MTRASGPATRNGLAALVLAAGRGERLRPLTDGRPKPLLPIGTTTLLDATLARVGSVVPLTPRTVAVNAHWLAEQIVAHVGDRAHLSVEAPGALGTAGAVGALRDWIAGRDLLIANSDGWYDGAVDLRAFVTEWDGEGPRLLVVADRVRPDFDGRWRFAGISLLPWSIAGALEPVPSGLYEMVWSRCEVEFVPTRATFIDCGTPEELERARRLAGSAPRAAGRG